MIQWLQHNWLEIFGALTGLLYIYLEIKGNIWLWPVGIISSVVYIIVFFVSKFYADMSLQVYYLIISIYGWALWARKKETLADKKELKISRVPKKIYLLLIIITLVLWAAIGIFLDKLTDSPIPYWDAFTTALSITATWMLAKKYIEQWIIWIIADLVSMGLYIYKDLIPTAILFTVFTTMAFVGYFNWLKIMRTVNE